MCVRRIWKKKLISFCHSRRELGYVGLNDRYDDAEDSKRTAKNLHDQNSHKELRVLGIRQCTRTPRDSHADAAEQVGETDAHAGKENGIPRVVELVKVKSRWKLAILHIVRHQRHLVRQDDGQDDPVDRRRLAEDDPATTKDSETTSDINACIEQRHRATTSMWPRLPGETHEIKFLDVILVALTAPPIMLDPVMNIPLREQWRRATIVA